MPTTNKDDGELPEVLRMPDVETRPVMLHIVQQETFMPRAQWQEVPVNRDQEIEFLRLIKDKIDNLIPKVSINTPLMEVSIMLGCRLAELEQA